MAKKGSRIKVALVCTQCGGQNYNTERNKTTTKEPLKLKKYCNHCRKRVLHKEKKKLN